MFISHVCFWHLFSIVPSTDSRTYKLPMLLRSTDSPLSSLRRTNSVCRYSFSCLHWYPAVFIVAILFLFVLALAGHRGFCLDSSRAHSSRSLTSLFDGKYTGRNSVAPFEIIAIAINHFAALDCRWHFIQETSCSLGGQPFNVYWRSSKIDSDRRFADAVCSEHE